MIWKQQILGGGIAFVQTSLKQMFLKGIFNLWNSSLSVLFIYTELEWFLMFSYFQQLSPWKQMDRFLSVKSIFDIEETNILE